MYVTKKLKSVKNFKIATTDFKSNVPYIVTVLEGSKTFLTIYSYKIIMLSMS